MEQEYYQISEMSEKCKVNRKTLIFYDNIGLLKPAYKDPDTHYRYYTKNQLFQLDLINILKQINFSLNEIKEMDLDKNLSYFADLIQLKIQQNNEQIMNLKKSNEVADVWQKMLRWMDEYDYKEKINSFTLREIPDRNVAFIRRVSGIDEETAFIRYKEIDELVFKHSLKIKNVWMGIYYGLEKGIFDINAVDYEVCREIEPQDSQEHPFIRTLEGGLYGSTIYKGPYHEMNPAYIELKNWLENQGYEIISPVIHVYIITLLMVKTQKDLITEIQLKVKKRS